MSRASLSLPRPSRSSSAPALPCASRAGAGSRSRFSDEALKAAGAEIVSHDEALNGADILIKVRRPTVEEVKALKPGALVVAGAQPL